MCLANHTGELITVVKSLNVQAKVRCPCYKYFFCQLQIFVMKVDCLPRQAFFQPSLMFANKHFRVAPGLIHKSWKGLPGTNTLADYKHS